MNAYGLVKWIRKTHNAAMTLVLYRAILKDVLRLLVLTTSVLVTVIAFGATIRPAVTQNVISGFQVVRYMTLAMVPMLQFALPFAAGFAATLAMHRMTVDNEVQAMSASGLSYRRILTPVAATGVAISLFMVVLTQTIIPKFWTMIEQMLTRDITQVMAASIQQGLPFQLGNLQITADRLEVVDHPKDTDADTRLKMFRVAVAELDDDGKVTTDVTAERAAIDVYRRSGRTIIKLILADTVAYNGETGHLVRAAEIEPRDPLVVPSARRDRPKAMSHGELIHLREHPDDFGQVIDAKEKLVRAMQRARAQQKIDETLEKDGRVRLLVDATGSLIYEVHADSLHAGEFRSKKQPVQVYVIERGQPTKVITTEHATLMPSTGVGQNGTLFDLAMDNNTVEGNARAKLTAAGLTVADTVVQGETSELSADELLERAHSREMAKFSEVQSAARSVANEVQSLGLEITARLAGRYAVSLTAFLLMVLGATLAMMNKHSLPLVVYMWAFLPAVLDLILLSTGEQMLRDGRWVGWGVLWSGNLLMMAGIVWTYLKLARN
ncbi:MAG TPA: LptF/LptG family permease, partial [Phycisphaerales bacterium]|nr:LptF/LptG family permease [Phycisphaerales bacterium]